VYAPLTDAALAAIGFVLLLTPTGSPPSNGWRRWGLACTGALAALVVAVANQLALVLSLLVLLGGAASLVTRFRHARGVERQQLRWIALAAALTGVAMAATGRWTGASTARASLWLRPPAAPAGR
jgi:hypothetical protein